MVTIFGVIVQLSEPRSAVSICPDLDLVDQFVKWNEFIATPCSPYSIHVNLVHISDFFAAISRVRGLV